MRRCVIVGGGQAALQVAVSLRQAGYEGAVAILCDEATLPYQRPPLSKGYLWGELDAARLSLRPSNLYQRLAIDLSVGARAVAVDRSARRVELADGTSVPYDALVLATGARPRRLSIPGADLEPVHHLRTVRDADRLRDRLSRGARLAVVGGGYIGLEVAAAATRLGAGVTVLEALPRVMSRVTGPEVAAFLTDTHRARGVEVMTDAAVTRFEPDPAGGVRIVLRDGQELPCDEVLVAVGVVPNVELAEACGLVCDDGIVVDACGRTRDPAIFAAGDCTNHPNPILGRRLRLESVHNAVEQAKAVASAIAGPAAPYAQVPWFYSDQYDLKLQTVGLFHDADRTSILGSPESREFAVLYLSADRIVAVDAVNAPWAFVRARKLFAGAPDGSLPLSTWRAAGGAAAAPSSMVIPA